MFFESSPYFRIYFLRILCSEYLLGLNLLDKSWTFINSMFMSYMLNTLSKKW